MAGKFRVSSDSRILMSKERSNRSRSDHEIWNAYGVMTFANGEVAPVTSLIEDWEV